ncbi:MAG: ABC transporter ATP-binding protein [Methanobrevibacter sp.]|nr:ABC transporter ATP-binding protein [Methanobrevibacter sp.]
MEKIIEVKEISFSYNNGDNNIFENISFSINKGDVLCILGPNGTGKTTLLKCLNGLQDIKSGEILLNGKNLKSMPFPEISKLVGYIAQGHVSTFPFSVIDVVLMGRSPYISLTDSPMEKDFKIAERSLKDLGILDMRDRPYTTLSGGEKQLVFLARVLTQEPKLLILDEPTSHLDFGNQIRLLELIENLSKKGLAIIMSSHFPDHTFLGSNKVAILKNKNFIALGDPLNVITKDNLKKAYDIDIELIEVSKSRKVCVPLRCDISVEFDNLAK